MAELRTFTCDECGITKGKTNHWFMAKVWPRINSFSIERWNEGVTARRSARVLHLCSESCAAKAMSKAIGAGQ
jgi:hypothetical protein